MGVQGTELRELRPLNSGQLWEVLQEQVYDQMIRRSDDKKIDAEEGSCWLCCREIFVCIALRGKARMFHHPSDRRKCADRPFAHL
jgi:hypothetical protein